MASYDLSCQQLEKLLAIPANNYHLVAPFDSLDKVSRLIALTRHYNGHIRENAVLCLGFIGEVSALPALIARVNDWAEPVRCAAKRSVRLLLVPEYAAHFVAHLPALFWLLTCQREDHQPLVDEVINFLAQKEHRQWLQDGLSSDDKCVARLSLDILVERQLASLTQLFRQAMLHRDPLVRSRAAQYRLDAGNDVDHETIVLLLKDTFAPIRQHALQYVIAHSFPVAVSLLVTLLFDKNALVRQRASMLLREKNNDPIMHYLAVLQQEQSTVTLRKISLWGLDEHHYKDRKALAEHNLDADYPSLYLSALRILLRCDGDDARERLLDSLCHPRLAIARVALKLFNQQRIYLSLAELQRCLEGAPSKDHAEVCYFLVRKLNKWDGLIFLLNNAQPEREALTQRCMAYWKQRFNDSGISPTTQQRARLQQLLNEKSQVISRKNPYIALFFPIN